MMVIKTMGKFSMFYVLKYKTLIFAIYGCLPQLLLIFICTFLFKFEIFYNKKKLES